MNPVSPRLVTTPIMPRNPIREIREVPATPKVPNRTVARVTNPVIIPTVTIPRPVVTTPGVTRPVVPVVPKPVVPVVAKPVIPVVPKPVVPVVTKPLVTVPTTKLVVPTAIIRPPVIVPTVTRLQVPTVIVRPPVVPHTVLTTPKPVVPTVIKPPTVPTKVILPTKVPGPTLPINVPVKTTAPIVPITPNDDSPTETFVNIIIGEQDADTMDEKEYLGYVRYLLNDQNKYDVFSRLFPENTCGGVRLRMKEMKSPTMNITPNDQSLVSCIHSKEGRKASVAVNFSYENHANLIWFDTENKLVNRYDPQVPGNDPGQDIMDDTIRAHLGKILPNYYYIGNTSEFWQCVQGVHEQGRTFKGDYYCQDYSLLYAINRIYGLSNQAASFNLVSRGPDILVDLAELLRALAYKIRAEQGKEIPERFRNWKPVV